MKSLPLSLRLAGQPCLVVGGGGIAARKIDLLLRAEAQVTVVTKRLGDAAEKLVHEGRVIVVLRAFEPGDVEGRLLVVSATGDPDVDEHVSRECGKRHILVNCVDRADLSSVTFPSIVDRDPVSVAISTDGASPTLARRIRADIEALLPASTGRLADFLQARRDAVKAKIGSLRDRQRFWDRVLDDTLPSLMERNAESQAATRFDSMLAEHVDSTPETSDSEQSASHASGLVSLVGAGPGDPDLLTLKALRCLQRADVVLYDNLVSPDIVDRARRDAERIYVGKRRTFEGIRQEAINDLLVTHAGQGKRVVRLKGGDPFIFGRGGEEVESLTTHGIDFEVVPGITAALGCAAYAGIPLTHRDMAQSVRFVTGHLRDGEINLDWPELAKPGQTLVVYMGLTGIEEVCERLIAFGADPNLPAAVISRGTLPDQQIIAATLETLPEHMRQADLHGPTTTIIGQVASLTLATSRIP